MKPVRTVIIMITLLSLAVSSCKTSQIEYRDRIIDNNIVNTVHDTIRERTSDSIYVEVKAKNDTVFCTKYIERIRYRDRIIETHDTCYRDSIITEYKETTKEIKIIPRIYRLSLMFTTIIIIFAFVKLVRWLKIR